MTQIVKTKPVDASTTATEGASTRKNRRRGPFGTAHGRRVYAVTFVVVLACCVLFTSGLLMYKNPMELGTPGFWLIAKRRAVSLVAMAIVAVCQSLATVCFHTVTSNRILTPSIMGFESLYRLIATATVFFLGSAALVHFEGIGLFLLQVALMVGLSLALYGWLFIGGVKNLHLMLLVGIVIGGGLGSVATFMQRMLYPSEFDVLAARLFGSVNNADAALFPVAIPLVVLAAAGLFALSGKLNLISLGEDIAINLGVNHKRVVIAVLALVSVLMAVSTSLVGPMTFLGFLVATLTYQSCDTYDHRRLLPLSVFMCYAILTGAYFFMNHVFHAQGVVSVVIELVGGLAFLWVIMKKGRL
ncbi:iron chelate uptake ABC transporter family permease subunit [Corynebacterium glucuronolyticum]|uniref:Iron chelate uptake ABC transporter family permease subunit n=1 Tax=Corynebacterium glucuronolyticum TaxID=39791 RepID=A0A7T4EF51_9CORY|nr:iron chelate uptake ABC transporter family permease subunit [Corynebacterium glucuronolyticum]EEI28501.1 iron chelate uptake ABC transporter, FeCT family, permease protein [Corynebacterium glucuronolyticum ATCC 51867]QQB46240.1 iron chelate uptake ABC transporter family permease subunit [Corynebacterium glucuronolyticum]QQU87808.1 iron chelate uptake ABC transporter family permease subunit [Corynebacterium glucuronolyticum]QRO81522.1 iron chelate uptake ABC transporter family permease subuni